VPLHKPIGLENHALSRRRTLGLTVFIMRVLLQDLAEPNGAQANYRVLLQAILNEFPGDRYTIVCPENSLFRSLQRCANVQFVTFHTGGLKELARFRWQAFEIGRIAREHQADVIWTCNVGPYVRTGIPQVLMAPNSFQFYPWQVARFHPRSRLTLAVLRWFFRRSLRCCDAVQVQTPLAAEHVRRIPGAPKRIEVIPKAVETEQDFQPQPLSAELQGRFDGGLGRKAFTFLYVATCSTHKNQAVAVKALDVLRSRGVRARLAISVTQEQLRKYIDPALVAGLIESGHLILLGWIHKEQLAAIYAACDGCVMPSRLEQLSSAHLEAMHWEKPQISADLPYAHDLCGEATLYADPDDPNDWADKMQLLIDDPSLRRRLTQAGLKRMETYPKTWREVARRVRTFLAEVAAAGRHACD